MVDKKLQIADNLKELQNKLHFLELEYEKEKNELDHLKTTTSNLFIKKALSIRRLSYLQRHFMILQNNLKLNAQESELKENLLFRLSELDRIELRIKFDKEYLEWIEDEHQEKENRIKNFVDNYDAENENLSSSSVPTLTCKQDCRLSTVTPTSSELSKDISYLKRHIVTTEKKLYQLKTLDEESLINMKKDERMLEDIIRETNVYQERNKAYETSIQQKLGRIKTEYSIISGKMFNLEMELSQK
ncbi:UNVERIFIED_CONTAM: hypothetical protein RMT77_009048 [Armadillidium vulgare]